MIPREILKKIRQIELRTNRIVTEAVAGARLCEPQPARFANNQNNFESVLYCEVAAGRRPALRSLQPSPQFRRIPRTVPDRKNFNFAMFHIDREVNRVRPRRWHFGLRDCGNYAMAML